MITPHEQHKRELELAKFKKTIGHSYIVQMEYELSLARKYRYMETKRKVKRGELPDAALAEFECWI